MAFDWPLPPKAEYERLVQAVAPRQELRAGFRFEPVAYPELKGLKLDFDVTGMAAPRSAGRGLKWLASGTELRVALSVNSESVEVARRNFVTYILSYSMLPSSSYFPGPAGFGDFSVGYVGEALAGKIESLIFFMRDNVGVTVARPRGTLDVLDLARRIDKNIAAQSLVPDLAPLVPQGLKGVLSRQEVRMGERVEFALTFDRKQGEAYETSVLTDNHMLKEESLRDAKAVWLARQPGVVPIQASVCDSKLLCSTLETAVKILEKE